MAKILLVDDEPDIVKMLSLRLRRNGYDVIVAADGEEALSKLLQEDPDLILLDIHLPKIEGNEIARRLKQDATKQHIPIIFITADTQAQSPYADDCLIKPFDGDEMMEKIERCLSLTTRTKFR